jgi:segregation and condensation protein A
MPARLDSASTAGAGDFAGPLDFLLDEVRRQRVAIKDVTLAPLVARFLKYVRSAKACNLNLDIEWLHMAATLIQWKSRSLLPTDPEEQSKQADDVRDELVQQLLARRREVAQDLARRQSVEGNHFSRAELSQFQDGGASEEPDEFVSVRDLTQQARDLACWVVKHREAHRALAALSVSRDEVTVSEMIGYLRGQFAENPGTELDALVLLSGQVDGSRRACLFLGLLEMARDQELQIRQTEQFGPVSAISMTYEWA